ncbi:hypothetical protein L1987_42922 [Smallanthus sonchifolius]|uniref:Uncharacterized protein n=1 Tax=Smallanthus sonchifolius TaxID=185202 RepID=A0ACB9GJN2_9ASTR|nr:hypothetical protein L1987_42922 [Smallanthus sonchifolius]
MDFPAPEFKQSISTPPKLSLFSLPSKPPTLPDGLTPPCNTVAAIPFLWEEAPGKPKSITSDDPPKSKIVRSLDLPPRLATMSPANNGNNHRDKLGKNVGINIIPSPTTVLGGPYQGIYASNLELDSSEKVVVVSNSDKSKGKIRMPLRKLMRKERSPVRFRSWRWDRYKDSFRDIGGGDRSPSIRFCSWRWDSSRDMGGGGGSDGGRGGGGSFDSGSKIGKVSRRNSFTFDNGSTSSFLANMYGILKQAVPWRSRR